MAALARSSLEIESLSAAAFLLRDARAPLNRAEARSRSLLVDSGGAKKARQWIFAELAVAQRSSHA
jgi:hypothetical protein